MKKISLLAGIAALSIVGGCFAAWSFGELSIEGNEIDTSLNIIEADTEVRAFGKVSCELAKFSTYYTFTGTPGKTDLGDDCLCLKVVPLQEKGMVQSDLAVRCYYDGYDPVNVYATWTVTYGHVNPSKSNLEDLGVSTSIKEEGWILYTDMLTLDYTHREDNIDISLIYDGGLVKDLYHSTEYFDQGGGEYVINDIQAIDKPGALQIIEAIQNTTISTHISVFADPVSNY